MPAATVPFGAMSTAFGYASDGYVVPGVRSDVR